MACKQPLSARLSNGSASATNYVGPMLGYDWLSTAPAGVPWQVAGTLRNVTFSHASAPGSGKSFTYTLVKNGSDTALVVTVADLATSGSNLSTSIPVASGDVIYWKRVPAGTPTVSAVKASAEFLATTANESGYGGLHALSASQTVRNAVFNQGQWGTGTGGVNTFEIVAAAGNLTALSYKLSVAPGSGKSFVLSLYKNGTKQDGSGGTPDTRVTIADAATTGAWSGTVTLAAGDYVYLEAVPSGTPAAPQIGTGVKFVATTDGESQGGGWVLFNLPTTGGPYYATPNQYSEIWDATEANVTATKGGATSVVIRGLRVRLGGTVSTGPLTFALRQNGNSTALTAALTSGQQTGSDVANSVTLSPADVWSLEYSQAGSPGIAKVASVAFIIFATHTTTKTGSAVLGTKGTARATRAVLVSLDDATNVLDEEGKLLVCGKFEVRGEVALNGTTTVSGTITTPLATDLTLHPTGDLILDPVGNDAVPATNYDVNLGSLSKKYLTLHAAELWVETLVAQNTIATIGGRILVLPTNTLTSDLAPGGTTIVVKYNNLASGDRVYLEADSKVEFMAVTSGASGTGPYTYSVTRDLDGTGANQWYAGDAVANTGTTGNGFIDLYSVRGVKAGTEVGPAIAFNVRLSSTYNDWAPRVVVGNLNGTYGVGATLYGIAMGDPAATNLVIDATNGIRIRSGTTNKLVADTSGNLALTGDLIIGTSSVFHTAAATALTTGVGIYMAGGTTPVFRVGDPAGNQVKWDGTDLTVVAATVSMDASGISIPAGNTTQSANYAYRFTSAQSGTNVTGMLAFETASDTRQVDLWSSSNQTNRHMSINITAQNGTAAAYVLCDVTAANVSTITISCVTAFANCNFVPSVDNTYVLGATGARWTAVWATNGTIQTSDARLKRNLAPSLLGLDFVRKLRSMSFQYLQDETRGRIGFLAQEVEAALAGEPFAALVTNGAHMGLNYAGFVPVLVTAIQELEARLHDVERR